MAGEGAASSLYFQISEISQVRTAEVKMIRVFSMSVNGKDFLDSDWTPYLSEERKRAAARRRQTDARQQYLGAEALVNRALEIVGADVRLPARFVRTPYGKPYLETQCGFFVNWSHSGEYAVCAVSDLEVGIDIQEMSKTPGERLIRRILRPSEYEEWEREPREKQTETFYRYWTAKESFLKMKGTGFYAPLDSFAVRLRGDGASVRELEGNTEYVCRFLPFEDPGYLAAVCGEDMETAPKIEYL